MKILLVSMPSLHFFRWTEQLENSGHDVYWFDIVDGNPTSRLPWVKKINGWRLKFPNFKGRYFIKSRLPFLYKLSKPLVERKVETEFEKVLLQVQPDIVHSFVLYISCTPIFPVMLKYKKQKWVYSSWGSDLYFFQNHTTYLNDIKRVLPRVNFLFADCQRDIKLAKQYGFEGDVLGIFPGGGGFNYNDTDKFIRPVLERNIILVKGYQGRSGRAIEVLKALQKMYSNLKPYKVVVFGADDEVELFINKNSMGIELNIECLSRQNFLPHQRILEFMGSALIYIGNSNSDGMPNTLLEAIAQGAFPIQSNPGGATEEVITHRENGLIIQDCNDSQEIMQHIKTSLNNSDLIEKAYKFNQNKIKPKYERGLVQSLVLQAYNTIIK